MPGESNRIVTSPRPPFYRDVTVVKWVTQVATLVLVVAAMIFLATQAGDSLEAKQINTGFDFLGVNQGFDLSEGIDTNPDTGGRALWAAMVNTLRLAAAGILFATLLGVLVGIMRLSHNWLVQKIASVFVEYFRNIPLLVHIFVIFTLITTGFPVFDGSGWPWPGWFHASNSVVSVPRLHIDDGFYQWLMIMIPGLIVANYVKKWRQKQQDDTGNLTRPGLSALAVLLVFAVVGWFIHPIFWWVGGIFSAIASFIDGIPQIVIQVLLSALFVAGAGWWIKRFLDSRRTPAGLAKLTDDDYFRMIFAGVGALFGVIFVFLLWPGLSSWIINSGRDLFEVLADKFSKDRTGPPISIDRPDIVQRGNFFNPGPLGLNMTQAFMAMFVSLVLYTGAYIAEIVRGGIMAVAKGQTEASQALGLSRFTMLQKVILPQAFRVAMPPLGNQYLNLTKNTSLAVAVGFSDLVAVGSTMTSQTGKSLEIFMIWMLFYLSCSLTISMVVNYINRRLAIVER